MKLNNIENRVLQTLVAAFEAKGLSQSAATEKAHANLAHAKEHVEGKLEASSKLRVRSAHHASAPKGKAKIDLKAITKMRRGRDSTTGGDVQKIRKAMQSLTAFARSLP